MHIISILYVQIRHYGCYNILVANVNEEKSIESHNYMWNNFIKNDN